MLGKTNKIFDMIDWTFFTISKFAVVAMMFLITLDSTGRYLLSMPIPWAYKLTESYLLVIIVFLSLSYVMKLNGHISVNLLVSKLSLNVRKIIFIFSQMLGFMLMLLIGYFALNRSIHAYQNNLVEIGVIDWPVWLVYIWVAIGSILFCVRLLLTILDTIFIRKIPFEIKGKEENGI